MSKVHLFRDEGKKLLEFVYGKDVGFKTWESVKKILPEKSDVSKKPKLPLNEKDSFLICYGDSFFNEDGDKPLKSLNEFCEEFLKDKITFVHILPFSPYSSDDGFSVIDYYEVNPEFGSWKEVQKIGKNFKMMADLVLNHCSKSNKMFKGFCKGEEKFKNFFISVESGVDLSMIVRPRTLPLLNKFKVEGKEKNIWTTFSEDQVDLNFENPEVLIEFVRIFLFYVKMGISVIRLDAIAYIWKEIGHKSIHHPKTHAIVQFFRAIVNEFYPEVLLLTETNVPHEENISYFGDDDNEAQMIYQFTLPPLTMYSFIKSDVTWLRKWTKTIQSFKSKTFFNFLSSHDGVGVTPLRGNLPEKEIQVILDEVIKRKGAISFKNVKGGKIPYELNINYLDAVCEENLDVATKAKKFLCSQSVMLSVCGVPAIYYHSLIGSQNYYKGVKESGIKRRINREKLNLEQVKKEIKTEGSLRNLVFNGFIKMLTSRRTSKAFHPAATQSVIDDIGNKCVFVVLRKHEESGDEILCLINSSKTKELCLLKNLYKRFSKPKDIISNREIKIENTSKNDFTIEIEGFEVLWLKTEK